ncbi:ATP-binding cassette domain-containing protein [Microbacterium sp. NPDC058342]|uniref:ATP-binding cassette domain-containing protein n=1 Tax=Microbacterium sp. NPDC058342 TaxID=3346454 RepID=UPI00365979D7
MSAVDVQGLRIEIAGRTLVDDVSFQVAAGECLAIVGESGAGKSLTARALLGLLPERARMTATRLRLEGHDVTTRSERGWRALRGRTVALVSQDALSALDPLRRIGREVAEPLEIHGLRADGARVIELLESVSMPDPEHRMRNRPHELSGGLRQRALIASAIAADPAVIVADEATTALDATVQARILELLRGIADSGRAVVFISHDFAAVRRVADRVIVMRAGRIVELGSADEVMRSPRSDHARELLAASTLAPRPPELSSGAPLLRAVDVSKSFDRPAVVGAAFTLRSGSTLGVVGESGSGKTTLARMIVGVQHPDSGSLQWVSPQRVQLVHQNPLGAFDPRWTIGRSLREALQAAGVPRASREARAVELLDEVGVDRALSRRRPHELSGGQRQRAAIARALAADPQVLVLDEPVSALDPTVRQRVLDLLGRLQRERALTMVFVSHDLAVIAAVSDDVLVMQDGVIVEQGAVADVFADPRHPFTRELLAAGR